jgi:hypothetical protein
MSFVSDVLVLVLSKLFFGFWEMMDARNKEVVEFCWRRKLLDCGTRA